MAVKKKILQFVHDIPLYPGEWVSLRNFLVEVKQRIQNLTGDPTVAGQIPAFSITTQSYSGVIEIRWETVPNANSYRIYRNTSRDFTTATVIAEVFGNLTKRYVDNVLTSGTYFYWISTVNPQGLEGVPFDLTGATGTSTAGAPADAEYIVASSSSGLTNERVIQNTSTITFDTATAGVLKAVREALSGDISASAGSNITAIGSNKVLTTHIADDQITTNKILASAVTAGKISVSNLAAINSDMGHITAGDIVLASGGFVRSGQTAYDTGTGFWIGNASGTPKFSIGNSGGSKLTWDGSSLVITGDITGSNISGGSITGTSFQTAGSGNNRVVIDSTNGFQLYDSSDTLLVQAQASVYAGILVNGLRAPNSNDIFLESDDQSTQLFVSRGNAKVSFVAGSVERGYFDNQDGNGGGNQPTSLVVRVNGALHRVNYNGTTGVLYI